MLWFDHPNMPFFFAFRYVEVVCEVEWDEPDTSKGHAQVILDYDDDDDEDEDDGEGDAHAQVHWIKRH